MVRPAGPVPGKLPLRPVAGAKVLVVGGPAGGSSAALAAARHLG